MTGLNRSRSEFTVSLTLVIIVGVHLSLIQSKSSITLNLGDNIEDFLLYSFGSTCVLSNIIRDKQNSINAPRRKILRTVWV